MKEAIPMNGTGRIFAIVALTIAILGGSPSGRAAPPTGKPAGRLSAIPEWIDGGTPGSKGTGIAILPDGTVAMVADRGRGLVLYTLRKGNVAVAPIDRSCAAPALAMDAKGGLHVACRHMGRQALHYLTNVDGTWRDSEVADAGPIGGSPAIVVDGRNRMHVSHYDPVARCLRYSVLTDGRWSTHIVPADGDVGAESAIAVDAGGAAHISCFDATNEDLVYATNASGEWHVIRLDSDRNAGKGSSIRVAGDGTVHIAYIEAGFVNGEWRSGLRYARGGREGFVVESVVADRTIADQTALAVDAAGVGRIAFFDEDSRMLKFAEQRDGRWILSTADDRRESGRRAAIALDAHGRAHVVHSELFGGLRYATGTTGAWRSIEVDPGGITSLDKSLALDKAGNPVVAYAHRLGDASRLCLARLDAGGAWVREVVDAAPGSGSFASLAVGRDGTLHVVHFDKHKGDLRYALWRDGQWALEVVDSAGSVGWYAALALDSRGRAHIAYQDSRGGQLKYAVRGRGGWDVSDVPGEKGLSGFIALALDREDLAHIVHSRKARVGASGTWALGYVTGEPGSWRDEPIASGEGESEYASIALDERGVPHVAFRVVSKGPSSTLRYATRGAGGWQMEDVEAGSRIGESAWIATGPGKSVAITHYDRDHGLLKLAVRRNGRWNTSIVDDAGNMGVMGRVVIDAKGRLHIVYGGEHGLWYLCIEGIGASGDRPRAQSVRLWPRGRQ